MSGLGDPLAGLAAIKKTFAGAAPHFGGDSRMETVRGFGFNPGALKMLTYVPDGLPAGAPLVVVLHGCTQGAAAHAASAGWLTLADRHGFAVLAPEQDAANNPNRCFNWFEPADTMRGGGEAASIHAMIAHMIKTHGLDSSRVFITGLSAGGAMTAAMLAAYPETFAAGAVIAGLPVGAAGNVQQALATMRHATALPGSDLKSLVTRAAPPPARWPRLTIWHGAADATVAPGNAGALARQWTALLDLPPTPDTLEMEGRWTRQRWLGDDGAVMVETNTLAGLGHGMPLAASGADAIGGAAPYMIETGISSALEIARFWGLAPAGPAMRARPRAEAKSKPHAAGIGAGVMHAVSPHVSAKVGDVIAKALRSAGLMR